MTVEFIEKTHSYLSDGRAVPSCTRILDFSGISNYSAVREEILERKSQIGTLVHMATQYYDEGALDWDSVDPLIINRTKAWVQFRLETDFVPRAIEKRCVATIQGMSFGLTVDREGLTKDRLGRMVPTIIDIKTAVTKQIFWPIQLAGYALGLPDPENELSTPRFRFARRRRMTVQLLEDGNYKKTEYTDTGDMEVFLSGLHIATWKMNNGEKIREIEE